MLTSQSQMHLSTSQIADNTMGELCEASTSGITRQSEALPVLIFPGKLQITEESTKTALGHLCKGKRRQQAALFLTTGGPEELGVFSHLLSIQTEVAIYETVTGI